MPDSLTKNGLFARVKDILPSGWQQPPAAVSRPAVWLGSGFLVLLWAVLGYVRWQKWGDPTIDCGREMYVPWALTQGKVLYRDVWYLYGPSAPYFNSLLFRIFGVSLNVLYLSGMAALLVQAIALYLTACALSLPFIGIAVGSAVLVQSFVPGFFTYPLPYSYAAVYGSVCAAIFILFVILAVRRGSARYVFGAATMAALAFITKLEYGAACYSTLALLIVGRAVQMKSWSVLRRDVLGAVPGVLLCAATVSWMVSLGGYTFLTQENIMSWPGSYFMRVYGQRWFAIVGLNLSPQTVGRAVVRAEMFFALWIAIRLWITPALLHSRNRRLVTLGIAAAAVASLGAMGLAPKLFELLFSPSEMVFLVALALPVFAFEVWRTRLAPWPFAIFLTFAFAVLLAFRIGFRASAVGYSIYYSGPVMIGFLILVLRLSGATALSIPARPRTWLTAAALIGFYTQTAYTAGGEYALPDYVRFDSGRGGIFMTRQKADIYTDAVRFMREAAARGETVMSVPEDISLYFFSETLAPTRVFSFVPGVVAPGKMSDEVIGQIERTRIRYLIWSNREFPEYSAPRFGIDFDQPIGEYLRTHYRPLRKLGTPGATFAKQNRIRDMEATVWERIP